MEIKKLKCRVRRIIEVDSYDFNQFIESIYGGSFEFEAIHEANNDSSYNFDAPNANMDFEGRVETQIRKGEYPTYCIHALFNVLHKDGHIPKGDYMINVSY